MIRIMKCARCGLRLATHSDQKCNEILFLERNMLRDALEAIAKRSGEATMDARKALRWVSDRQAHEVVENDPLTR